MVRLTNPFDAADARLAGTMALLLLLATLGLLWLAAVVGLAMRLYGALCCG